MAKKREQYIMPMENVVESMRVFAQELLSSLGERYPELELSNYYVVIDDKYRSNWEYYCLAVGAGLSLLNEEFFPGEHEQIEKQLKAYDPKLIAYTDDFTKFILKVRGINSPNILEEQIAYWFISKYKQKKPTKQELHIIAPTLGRALIHTTKDIRKISSPIKIKRESRQLAEKKEVSNKIIKTSMPEFMQLIGRAAIIGLVLLGIYLIRGPVSNYLSFIFVIFIIIVVAQFFHNRKAKKEKDNKLNKRNISHNTSKSKNDTKIHLIKLGFEKENGFKLANKDMYEMELKQLEKYYKIGLKSLKNKR